MIKRDGNLLRVTTAMTVETVSTLLSSETALFDSEETEIDLSTVTRVDSAALALMFEWMRLAKANNCALFFSHLPQSLSNLASLYGVLEMIPQRMAHEQ